MKRTPVLLMARELNLGGTERQLTEIARSLDRTRFEPHAGCFRAEGLRSDELREAGVPVARFPAASFLSPSLLGAARGMGAYVRRHGIGVVHTFDVPMNLFGVPVARMFGVPRVIASQRAHRGLTPGIRRHLLRITDQIADAIVVNCLSVRRELVEEERVPAARVHVCYNGVDTSVFRPQAAPRPASLDGACLVIGIVCALRPEKDLGTLLRAFAEVKRMRPGLRLVLVGSGPERANVESLARELGLGEACVVEPATSRVADWLRAIDIFVLPSLSEALSNSLMEAMACGCCAVASRAGGNPELVSHGSTGLLFEPGDAAGLAAALRLLTENEELRTGMGRAAARRIHDEFSLEASARAMGEIYRVVLDEPPASAPRLIT
jgi:glycosyltransferase involved in cell wall biosynthesis